MLKNDSTRTLRMSLRILPQAISSMLIVVGCVGNLCIAANTVFFNASVYTVNPNQPVAEAVVVDAGKIVFVGGNNEAKSLAIGDSQLIDLKGQWLLPGFIDTHNHVFEGASEIAGNCKLSPTGPLQRQRRALLHCKEAVAGSGDWVIGYGHQLDALMAGNQHLNVKRYLDDIFPDNPVVIMEESSHSMIVNSLALEKAGIDADSPNPIGGSMMRMPDSGKLNGVLFDNAGDIVMEVAWNSQQDKFAASYDGLLAGMQEAVAHGITTIGDGRLYWRRGWHKVWLEALSEGEIVTRTSLRPWIYPGVPIDQQVEYLSEIKGRDNQGLLVSDQVKLYIDGVMHFGTGKLLRPYLSSWQSGLPYGLNYIDPEKFGPLLAALAEIGYGAHIHAVGDAGVREALDAIEQVRDGYPGALYSMTHLELVDPGDYHRFRQLNVHADFQAGADFFGRHDWAIPYIGKVRAGMMLPMRTLFEEGANITFSSDWTVNDINPLVAIANSLRLKDTKGLPDIESAIRAATINGAKALDLDDVTGSIEVGKSADFVLLDQNILKANSNRIRRTKVLLTVLQGAIVFNPMGF